LLGRRFGNRAVSLAGASLLAAFALVSGLAPSFSLLLVFRAGAGAGAGLFFSPAIGLVASLYPPGRRGVPVGGFSSAFSAGSAAGLFGTALLVPSIGWRFSLVVGGLALAVLTLAAVVVVPRNPTPASVTAPRPGRPLTALRHRGAWAIGIAFVGLEGASFATGQFIVPFSEAIRGWSAAIAGVVGMMFVLPSVVGGPLGGWIAERRLDHRRQFLVATAVGGAAIALLPFGDLAATVAIGSAFSFVSGFDYAVMYVLPHFWPGLPADEIPLAIGLFNAIQLAGGASVAYLFGWVVAQASYGVAWEVLAGVEVVTLVALVGLPSSARSTV
jgi:predicted MFS family arabinose efflux permease